MQARAPVRSYVLRGGRITPAQARALEAFWSDYGLSIDDEKPFDFEHIFGRRAPVALDIGFGNGESVLHAARMFPEEDIVGIEVHQPGLGALLLQLNESALTNVRVVQGDACEILRSHIAPGSLAAVRLFFPDPWPKKRHHKRRLVQPDFVDLAASRLEPGGVFHLATDWPPYAEYMLETVGACGSFENQSPEGDFVARPPWRPITRFERRGLKYDQPARDLLFKKRS